MQQNLFKFAQVNHHTTKSFFLSVTVLLLSNSLYSQAGHVEIIKGQRIDGLVKKQGMIIPPATSPQIPGYRVQLFFDADRKSVDDARNKFINMYPKVDTYVIYNAPNYFLKVGDFRTQLEAEKVKDSFVRDFPTCFIVKEMINLPRIDQD